MDLYITTDKWVTKETKSELVKKWNIDRIKDSHYMTSMEKGHISKPAKVRNISNIFNICPCALYAAMLYDYLIDKSLSVKQLRYLKQFFFIVGFFFMYKIQWMVLVCLSSLRNMVQRVSKTNHTVLSFCTSWFSTKTLRVMFNE